MSRCRLESLYGIVLDSSSKLSDTQKSRIYIEKELDIKVPKQYPDAGKYLAKTHSKFFSKKMNVQLIRFPTYHLPLGYLNLTVLPILKTMKPKKIIWRSKMQQI